MATDLINGALRSTPGPQLDSAMSGLDGRPESLTQGLRAAVAGVVGSLAAKSVTPAGLAEIMAALQDDWHGHVGSTPRAYVGDDAVRSGASRVQGILGERRASLIDHLCTSLGLGAGSAASLVNLAVPLALAALSRTVGVSPSDRDVRAVLSQQQPFVQPDNAPGAGPFTGVSPSGPRGGLPWWLWLLALLLLLLVALLMMRSCQKTDLRPAVAMSDVSAADASVALTREAALASVNLPDGTTVNLRSNTLNDSLQRFLSSDRPVPETFTFEDVRFDDDSAALRPEAQEAVLTLAAILKAYPKARVKLDGHTDEKGAQALNKDLSERRARAVADALAAQGVQASRMSTAGLGETRPTASNTTVAGRQENRRTDLTVVAK